MTLALRLILVISLIVQSVCAMAQPRCATKAVADSADVDRSAPVCACCCGGGSTAGCGMMESCGCAASSEQTPRVPATPDKSLQLERALAMLPATFATISIVPEHGPAAFAVTSSPRSLTSNTIQSLLCIWQT